MNKISRYLLVVIASICLFSCEKGPKEISVSGVFLNPTVLTLIEEEIAHLTVTMAPSNATNKNVSWKSDNPSVASVSNGTVTAIAPGSATITVTTEDGNYTATCEVTVNAKVFPVSEIKLDKTTLTLYPGETTQLTATVYPTFATDKTVSWNTSDATIATVHNGLVTAVKGGYAKITAQAGNATDICAITVLSTVSGDIEGTGEEDWKD